MGVMRMGMRAIQSAASVANARELELEPVNDVRIPPAAAKDGRVWREGVSAWNELAVVRLEPRLHATPRE